MGWDRMHHSVSWCGWRGTRRIVYENSTVESFLDLASLGLGHIDLYQHRYLL